MFCSQKGGHLDRTRLFRIVKRLLKKAGIDESVHTLRKTGGTHYYIKSNYDLIATQQFLGHTNPSVTRQYINMTTEQLEHYSEVFSEFLMGAIEGEMSKGNTRWVFLYIPSKRCISVIVYQRYQFLRPCGSLVFDDLMAHLRIR